MKNLLSLLFILLTATLSAQTFNTDQLAFSTLDEPSFQLACQKSKIHIKGKKVKITSGDEVVILKTKEKMTMDTFDMFEYFYGKGYVYEVKANKAGIAAVELIPDTETKLFAIKLIKEDKNTIYYNHLVMQ